MPTRVSSSTSRRRPAPVGHQGVAHVENAVGVVQTGGEKHGPERERGGYTRRHHVAVNSRTAPGNPVTRPTRATVGLARGLQRSSANRKDGEEGEKRLQLLDPDAYSGDAEVDLCSRSGRPLVDQPERVAEPPPGLALRNDPESDLVANHQERHVEISCTGQKPIELR